MYSTSTHHVKPPSIHHPIYLAIVHPSKSEREMHSYIEAYESATATGIKATPGEQQRYEGYWSILASPFSTRELIEMHEACCRFRDELHSGGTPSGPDQLRFLAFSKIVYEKGVPYGF